MSTFIPHTERHWQQVAPGVEFSILRQHADAPSVNERGMTLLVRMAKGAHAALHHHPGGEETYILSGKLRVGEHALVPGDYLWTPPGTAHDGDAEEETTFFVVLPHGLRVGAAEETT